MNAGSFFGRLAPPFVADHVGRFNTYICSTVVASILCLSLWLKATTLSTLISFAALYGIFSGATVALVTSCVAQISDPAIVGTRIGILYAILSVP